MFGVRKLSHGVCVLEATHSAITKPHPEFGESSHALDYVHYKKNSVEAAKCLGN